MSLKKTLRSQVGAILALAMLLLAIPLVTSTANEAGAQGTCAWLIDPTQYNWIDTVNANNNGVPYYVHSSYADNPAELAAIRSAIQTWEDETGLLDFRYAGSTNTLPETAALVDPNRGPSDDLMVVGPDSGQLPTRQIGVGGIGISITTTGAGVQTVNFQFDVALNADADLGIGGAFNDLESLVLHEFGHVLALGHTTMANQVMLASIQTGTQRRDLGSQDASCIRSIYGDPPPPGGGDATCNGQTVTVDIGAGELPTEGNDVILGTSGADVIGARGGNDIICGEGGNDSIWGQNGNDTIFGGDGDDRIRGGAGDDIVRGGDGEDNLTGGTGEDQVYGEGGNDKLLRGNTGNDLVDGGAGNETLIAGNGGEDTVNGGGGNDKVTGGPRPDILNGGAGNDELSGHKGADTLNGGDGNDELLGGPQPDTLNGGGGTDYCHGGTTGNGAIENDTVSGCEDYNAIP